MDDTSSRNAAVESALATRATGSDSTPPPTLSETRLAAARLTSEIGWNRNVVSTIHEGYHDLHKEIHDVEWRTASSERGRATVMAMLDELAGLGFAWRDIARLVNVSVPAVQKWRKGEKASGDSRARIASLLAACDLIKSHYMVEDIASWFEMPLSSSAPVTPITLYAANRADLVFEFASGHQDPEVLLSEFEPDWRERYRSDFEVFEASDGHRSIRMKG